ncbi:MAG: hypothetical protein PHO10_11855 [Gemmiger sp.]|nr:hypothetical protein [Gemmiger sp.]
MSHQRTTPTAAPAALATGQNATPPPGAPVKLEQTPRQKLRQTVLLVLLALVSISAASYAWFSLATSTRVRSMNLDITSGVSLRFDTAPHAVFEEYVKTLNFAQIAAQITAAFGFDPQEAPLEPVTTGDGTTFADEQGAAVDGQKGEFLEFTLHFMATQDMTVHLTSENGPDGEDGTLVQAGQNAANPAIVQALRISFTAGDVTKIYQPQGSGGNTFTLATAADMQYNDTNALFALAANTNQPVTVRVWLEGTDAACTDDLRGSDYQIRLRFAGTDADGTPLA